MTEEWKTIEGYDRYEISSLGHIRSKVRNKDEGRILKPMVNRFGYLQVFLYKGKGDIKGKSHRIHRLVAEHFIPNPSNLPCINHKYEDKLNNCIDNLEWCTHQYNDSYGTRGERISKKVRNHPGMSRKVEQLTMEGKHVEFYPSVGEACRKNNFNHTHITECCNGKHKHHKGFVWRYV